MTWHDMLREGREAIPNLSQKKLADEIGVSQALIAKIERGLVQGSEFMGVLVDRLGLNRSDFPDDVFKARSGTGKGYRAPNALTPLVPEFARDPAYWAAAAGLIGDVPLYASAEGGRGSLIIERDSIGSMKRPPLLQGVKDGYAIYHTGESMVPEFEPGDTLFINPRLPVLAGTSCLFYNSAEDEPRASVKRFLSATDELWKVRQFQPQEDFTMERAEWPVRHRIVAKNFR